MLAFVVLLSLSLALGAPSHGSYDLAALASPTTTDAAGARLLDLAQSNPVIRASLAKHLPVMLLQTNDIRVAQSEAKLAGGLRIVSTIPSLIQLLSGRNYNGDGSLSTRRELENDPIARALYEIGKPALPALREALKSSDRQTRERAEAILILTNTPESRAILKEHLAVEPDGGLRAYLRANGINTTH